jgi:putative membrane protein
MTRHLMIAGACAIALSLGACNKNNGTGNAANTNNPTPDAHPAATIPTPANETNAQDYVTKAANADMLEVQAAKVALQRSSNADVKAFAKEMVSDHTKSTDDLKSTLKAANLTLTPPTQLPDDMANTVNDLKTVDAKAFDKKYMDGQVDAHQDTLDLQSRYAKDGDNAQLKAFAATTAQKVQEHLTKAKTIRDGLK